MMFREEVEMEEGRGYDLSLPSPLSRLPLSPAFPGGHQC